jgi:hypothetical protein
MKIPVKISIMERDMNITIKMLAFLLAIFKKQSWLVPQLGQMFEFDFIVEPHFTQVTNSIFINFHSKINVTYYFIL